MVSRVCTPDHHRRSDLPGHQFRRSRNYSYTIRRNHTSNGIHWGTDQSSLMKVLFHRLTVPLVAQLPEVELLVQTIPDQSRLLDTHRRQSNSRLSESLILEVGKVCSMGTVGRAGSMVLRCFVHPIQKTALQSAQDQTATTDPDYSDGNLRPSA